MARSFTYTCDGCGHSRTTGTDDTPSGFAELTIRVEGYTNWRPGGGKEQYFTRLLCSDCQIELRYKCDPCQWPRTIEELTT